MVGGCWSWAFRCGGGEGWCHGKSTVSNWRAAWTTERASLKQMQWKWALSVLFNYNHPEYPIPALHLLMGVVTWAGGRPSESDRTRIVIDCVVWKCKIIACSASLLRMTLFFRRYWCRKSNSISSLGVDLDYDAVKWHSLGCSLVNQKLYLTCLHHWIRYKRLAHLLMNPTAHLPHRLKPFN